MAISLYWIVQADATATPTGAQIVAGQDGTGAAALASGSEAYTSAGNYSEASAITGLSSNTAYEQAWVAYDGSSYSSVVTATITTATNVSTALSGSSVSGSAGSLIAAIAQSLAGSVSSVSSGTLVSAITQPLTGSSSTVSEGTLTASVGSGNDVALSGSASTSSAGTLVTALTQPISGSEATVSAGSAVAAVAQPITGVSVTASAGTLTVSVNNDVSISLGGSSAAVIAGDLGTLGGTLVRRNDGAGRSKKKRRQVVEIDGEQFVVNSDEEAIALLDQASKQAEQIAQLAQSRANKAERRPVKQILRDARRSLVVPEIQADTEVSDYANKVLGQIRDLYQSTIQSIEISAMLRRTESDAEDEEEILLLMA